MWSLFCNSNRLDSNLPLSMSNSKQSSNFIERFVFGFRHLPVSKDPEHSKEDTKRQECVVLEGCLHCGKSNAHKEVGTPMNKKKVIQGSNPGAQN